jgi:outer membrane lipoprotein-sorting protein
MKHALAVALLLGFGVAHAQPKDKQKTPIAGKPLAAPAAAKQPSLVDQVLAKVEANYKTPKHFAASFDQTLTRAIGGKPAENTGTILVEKPSKIKVVYLQPKRANPKPKTTTLFDGKTVYGIDHGNTQYFERPAASSDLPALVAFFLGEGSLTTDFKVQLTSDKAHVPPGATALELTPKQPSAAHARVILVLDGNSRVARSIVFNSSGDIQEMRFRAVVLDKPAPTGTFVFDRKQVDGFERIK